MIRTVTIVPRCQHCDRLAVANARSITDLRQWLFVCQEHFDRLGFRLGNNRGYRLWKKEAENE